MRQSGIFDPDDGSESDDDWTPQQEMQEKRKRKKQINKRAKNIHQNKNTRRAR